MKSLEVQTEFIDNLLDFSFDIGEEDDVEAKTQKSDPFLLSSHGDKTSDDIVEEEELEWISNKDAFPKLESFVDMIPDNLNDKSPVSVLDSAINITTSVKVPVRARTNKRKRRTEQWRYHCLVPNETTTKKKKEKKKTSKSRKPVVSCSRKCQHCRTEETPQWRAGPTGPKTLCNACGVRYKSGRLVPEYRPANSPTFSVELHSNSHRKVMEMRRQKNVDS